MKVLKLLLAELVSGFKKIIASLNYTSLCAVLDALFIFLYGGVSSFFWKLIEAQLYSIAQFLSQDATYLVGITSNPIFKPYIGQILKYSLMLVLCVYLLYTITQGVLWFIVSRKILHHKVSFWKYFGKFSLFSLFYFILLLAAVIASLWHSFATLFANEAASSVVFSAFMVVLCYFMFLSYALILKHGIKEAFLSTFRLGIKKIKYIAPMYLVLVIIAFVLNILLNLAAGTSHALMIAAGVILVLPFMTFSRAYITEFVAKIDEQHHGEHSKSREKEIKTEKKKGKK